MRIETTEAQTFQVDIWVAGDYQTIVNACLKYCERGLCVHVVPATFAYCHGMETGAKVGILNYPRFPSPLGALWRESQELAKWLLVELSQGSCSVVGPDKTLWLTKPRNDKMVRNK